MPFSLPNFNLTANVWEASPFPPTAPPDLVIPCQLYIYSRTMTNINDNPGTLLQPPIYLRTPSRAIPYSWAPLIECGAGDGFFYVPLFRDRMHRGFPNEYDVWSLEQIAVGP